MARLIESVSYRKHSERKITVLLKHSQEPVVQINVQKKQRHGGTKQPNPAITH